MTDAFERLAPFIREFVWQHGWTELRAIQAEACRIIFDTDSHLLLASGTASGKTEAAFLPILTLLHEQPADSVGVLYIGPLKALINDQFARLNDLLKEAEIPAWHWHGDVSQAEKKKFLNAPRGVLQITPESLEGMLINKTTLLPRLFHDLRFVVIDEVHAFMGSDRGRQVLCQLRRLEKYAKQPSRRVGLSATLGDYSQAEGWLGSGTDRAVQRPAASAGQQRIRLGLEHFTRGQDNDRAVEKGAELDPFCCYLYDRTKGSKAIIFVNNRSEAEATIANVRQVAEAERSPDIYHVHHGSIAAPLREAAEKAMRDPEQSAVTAATITLELGIDLGDLERTVQIDAPFSVASFVQRLGRTGRRGGASEMWFATTERAGLDKSLPEQIPWSLLQAIAVVQLYLEEKWIEPIPVIRYPFSLLYHQTMSALAAGELTPAALAQRVLTLPPFDAVTPSDYKELLHHLLSLDHIQQTDEGTLIIGLEGEKIVGDYKFLAVFADRPEYAVFDDARQIGSVTDVPAVGDRIGLAGRAWEVRATDPRRMKIFVKPVKGKVVTFWRGGGGAVHSRILQRMRRVVTETAEYPYLLDNARDRLREARALATQLRLEGQNVFSAADDGVYILPWMGSVATRTLERALKIHSKELGEFEIRGSAPYFLFARGVNVTEMSVTGLLGRIAHEHLDADALVGSDDSPLAFEKFDDFVPPTLLRKAFISDRLDIQDMQACLALGKAAKVRGSL